MVAPGADASPVVNIVGERVALGPLRREDIPLHHRWHNDFAIRRTLGEPRPRTIARELAAYERDARAEGDAHFTIYTARRGDPSARPTSSGSTSAMGGRSSASSSAKRPIGGAATAPRRRA